MRYGEQFTVTQESVLASAKLCEKLMLNCLRDRSNAVRELIQTKGEKDKVILLFKAQQAATFFGMPIPKSLSQAKNLWVSIYTKDAERYRKALISHLDLAREIGDPSVVDHHHLAVHLEER